MKQNIILTFIFVSISMALFSQSDFDRKLSKVYSTEKIERINSNLSTKAYYTELLSNSFRIMDVEHEKLNDEDIEVLTVLYKIDKNKNRTPISIDDFLIEYSSDSFNILEYGFERHADRPILFRLGNTSKVLILDSINTISKKSRENQ